MAGEIGWIDLTCKNADNVRDFYQAVVGWRSEGVSMGDYDDYAMSPGDSDAIAGICHATGVNAEMPGGWLIYITVDDLDKSLAETLRCGGEIVVQKRSMDSAAFAVVRDPSGACAALYQPGTDS